MPVNLNRLNRLVALAALCLFLAPQAAAQQVVTKVDEYMNAAVQVKHFSGSVLVARDGQPVVSKGYGMANYELNVANTPQTAFRLGSITKQFTAMAIMMLQERGKLSVSDPICKHLENCPAAWQPITIRHLLTHTSGIPNYTSFPGFFEKNATQPYTAASLVDLFRDKPLDFQPGEKFNYSNSGYHLLGLIIEKVSGAGYATFLRDNIFAPLGLKSTGYDDTRALVANRASGYQWAGKAFVNAPYLNMTIPYSAGALYSTTEDLLTWDKALYTEKLVSRKSLDEMFTPFREAAPGTGYAYGWSIGKKFERQVIEHSGGINGFSTDIVRFPAERVTVIVLSNNQGFEASKAANDLAAIVFGAPYRVPAERQAIAVAPATLEKYVGQYQIAPSFIITITSEDGRLMAQPTGQAKVELFAESETEFFLKVVDAQVTFVKDAQGQVVRLILHQGGRDTPAPKIK
ncbi:MAG TPA: serine hydrolase [Blastocatellia bacterium]|nr:serine hydrolase [Blastocatellia bacterium]